MLNPDLLASLATHFTALTRPVELVLTLDDSPTARELEALARAVAGTSPQLSITTGDGPGRRPALGITTPDAPARIHFAGVPSGHEFTSLVLAILQVGGHPPRVAPAVLDRVRSLTTELTFETVVSLSCQLCPDVVQALNLLASQNPRIRHTMIDGALAAEEMAARGVLAVPSVFLNGTLLQQGRATLEDLLDAVAPAVAAPLTVRDPYDVLVLGGGPAGVAAAVYAARKGIRTGLVAERLGGQLLDTLAVENFISVPHTDGPALARGLREHLAAYAVEVLEREAAVRLVPGSPLGVELTSGARLEARAVVVATGARWRTLGVPGEVQYRNRGVAYCPHCDGPLFRGKPVAVVGGGNSGVEAAIDLAGLASHVTLLEFEPALRADAVLVAALRRLPNVTILTHVETRAVEGDGGRVTGLALRDRSSGAEHGLAVAGVFVQIGLVPNTEFLRGTVPLTPRGEIRVDARGATEVPGVYAAGDCTTVPFKQIVVAAGEGAKAALGAFEARMREPPARAA